LRYQVLSVPQCYLRKRVERNCIFAVQGDFG
jgi:hypothetical protein